MKFNIVIKHKSTNETPKKRKVAFISSDILIRLSEVFSLYLIQTGNRYKAGKMVERCVYGSVGQSFISCRYQCGA